MSYLGFVKMITRDYLSGIDHPKVLEIGVHYGQSCIPMIYNLSLSSKNFLYSGVDILIRKQLCEQLSQLEGVAIVPFDKPTGRDVMLFQENSLAWLDKIDIPEIKYDLVMIDGDHNYYTVSNELRLVQKMIKPESLIICDDFFGKYSQKDMFYSDRLSHRDVDISTDKVENKKEGVMNAVCDFINEYPSWSGRGLDGVDPIILYRNDIWNPIEIVSEENPGEESKGFARSGSLQMSKKEKK
jgi:hypothetical protein